MAPPAAISIIGTCMESVVYGINCTIYGYCMYVLLRRPHPRALVIASTTIFALCTAHMAASIQELLNAFIYGPSDVPNYANNYWFKSSPLGGAKNILYVTSVVIQNIILIWRFRAVYSNCNWGILVVPVLVQSAHIVIAYTSATLFLMKPNLAAFGLIVTRLALTGWALDIAVNVSLTLAIGVRLWWMSHKVAMLGRSIQSRYSLVANIIVGSGSLFAGATIIMLALYATNNPSTHAVLDIACQLAVLTPLLIVVKVGVRDTQDVQTEYESAFCMAAVSGSSEGTTLGGGEVDTELSMRSSKPPVVAAS